MKKIPKKSINRVLVYIRTLEGLIKNKHNLVSSRQLADMTGLSDVQIRKDISSFGKVGTPRIGYNTIELKNILERFLLQDGIVHVVLFGVGNLGTAILKYPGFHKDRIKLVAAFDKDKVKVGKKVSDVAIYPIDSAPMIIKKTKADIGIIAVPKEHAQEVADIIVLSGLKGIMNFVPTSINVPDDVRVRSIDLTIEFLSLFCKLQRGDDIFELKNGRK